MTNSHSRVALVTGGGSGIGASVAEALVKDDWHVVIAGRRQEALDSFIARMGTNSAKLTAVVADVTDEQSVKNLFATVKQLHGRLDLLFNNAGTGAPAVEIDQLSLEDWNKVVAVNLTGVFLCTREAFGMMRNQQPQGGRIINNGSVSAHMPRPLSIAYTSTKHAITGLTKTTQLDGRKFNIACSQIDVGNAATEIGSGAGQGALQADGSTKAEPLIDPDEVARAVAYMASLSLDANVANMTIMATKMPFVGRG
jgi:NAD(P)-dependent dehydrogenase (short-subunit alcohol dehydrogenase family)